MKRWFFLGLMSSFFLSTSFNVAHAEEIQGFRLTAGEKILFIEWEKLPENFMYEANYAIQWSDAISKMRNVDPMKQFVSSQENTLEVRLAPFKDNTWYFRIYTYEQDGREKIYGSSSKVLEAKFNYSGKILATEWHEPQDPVINASDDIPGFEFGKLRIKNELPNSADFLWSVPNLSKSDIDGFMVVISEKETLDDPVVSATVGRDSTDVQITGLEPSTQYYARGFFYKTSAGEKKKVGEGSPLETFKTLDPFTSAQKTKYERLVQRRVIRHPFVKVSVDGSSTEISTTEEDTDNTTTTGEEDDTTTSTTSSSSSTTVKTNSGKYTRSQIEAQIKRLESELSVWRTRLQQLGGSSSVRLIAPPPSTTSSSPSSNSSTVKNSSWSPVPIIKKATSINLSRLREILKARRSSK